MRTRTRSQLLMLIRWALVVLLGVPALAAGQSTFATLTGVVTDPSGGIVPGATIDVTSVRTQAVRTTISDQAGAYLVTSLDAGVYQVRARIDGFADAAYETELLARQTVRVDVHLALAGAAERVDVTAAQPLIETDSATIDHSRSGDDINRLALNFRATSNTSPIVVATLAEGVQQDRTGAISVAGNLPFMTSFSIDGIASHSSRNGGPSRELFPSVESIAEFKVSSANNNAEFMQVTDVTTTSKSGSNQLRGTGFWFIKDSALSSVDRFAPKDATGKAIKPEIQTNSYGISGGGPVLRNRTFFYGTFEGVREPNEVTLSQVVPPDAFRAGDLSSVATAIRNPFTGQPFPNNQIPVSPASAKILSALYERQNQNTGPAINRPNYIVNAPGNYDQKGFDIRADQNVSSNQNTPNVILVTLDGVRVQEMFGGLDLDVLRSTVKMGEAEDTATYKRFWAPTAEARRERLMPFLWGTLLKHHGSIVGNPASGAVMRITNRHRFSYPGYAEILTGQARDDVINSNDARRNPFPTVLEFVRKRLNVDVNKVAAFASWRTFDAIVEHDPGTIVSNAGIEPYPSSDPLVLAVNQLQQETLPPWENVRHDSFTFRMAMTHLAAQHPRLLYLALDEPDDWAHDGRYDHVLLSLARIDGYLEQLWKFVESRDEYRGKTTIILSVDHGRGRTPQDWRNHGKDVEGAQDIWMAVVSPSSRLRGEWPAGDPIFQNQIASTVAAVFGLDFTEAAPGAGKPILRIVR